MGDLTIIFHPGDSDKPLVIFIHGMGMDANMWADPAQARVLGGKYPLRVLLNDLELKTSFHDLRDLGYPVLAWSQKRPSGSSLIAEKELDELVESYGGYAQSGIILIGHSRGGLIARRYLQDHPDIVEAVITIAAPHKGSSMAKWAVYISPLTTALKTIMDLSDKDIRSAMHRVLNFLSGQDIREMLPGSDFLMGLSAGRTEDVSVISIGGTDPSMVKIAGTSLPQLLAKVVPDSLIPDELTDGKGDGMVSAESAVYPGGDEHRNFHAHHAALIFNREVRDYILQKVIGLTE